MQLFQLFYKFHSIYCASLYPLKYKKMKLCTTFLAKFHLLISIPLPVHSPELPHLPRPIVRNKRKLNGQALWHFRCRIHLFTFFYIAK